MLKKKYNDKTLTKSFSDLIIFKQDLQACHLFPSLTVNDS